LATTRPVIDVKPFQPAGTQRMRWLVLGVGAAIILATAIVQGVWSDRWIDTTTDSLHLAARIERIPLTLGDWQGTEQPIDARAARASGAVGQVSRIYRNQLTGEQISLYLICGHMRDVCVHTPDRCYPAIGFEQQGEPVRFTFKTSAGPIETYTSTFRQEEATGIHRQRVFWTWGYEDQWQAPNNPRVSYGGVSALYKMYLISTVPPNVQQTPEESPAIKFAQDALGEINAILFVPETKGE